MRWHLVHNVGSSQPVDGSPSPLAATLRPAKTTCCCCCTSPPTQRCPIPRATPESWQASGPGAAVGSPQSCSALPQPCLRRSQPGCGLGWRSGHRRRGAASPRAPMWGAPAARVTPRGRAQPCHGRCCCAVLCGRAPGAALRGPALCPPPGLQHQQLGGGCSSQPTAYESAQVPVSHQGMWHDAAPRCQRCQLAIRPPQPALQGPKHLYTAVAPAAVPWNVQRTCQDVDNHVWLGCTGQHDWASGLCCLPCCLYQSCTGRAGG